MKKLFIFLTITLLFSKYSYAMTYKEYKTLINSSDTSYVNTYMNGLLNGVQIADRWAYKTNLYKTDPIHCPPPNLNITFEIGKQLIKDEAERFKKKGNEVDEIWVPILLVSALEYTFPCKD